MVPYCVAVDLLSWDGTLSWLRGNSSSKSFKNEVRKLAWQCSIYIVWLERNKRYYSNEFRPCGDLLHVPVEGQSV